jgi:hypothetical protein
MLLSVCLYISVSVSSLLLLGNGSVKTFPWQQKNFGCVVFCVVHVIWKDRKQFMFPRICVSFLMIVEPTSVKYHVMDKYMSRA